MPTVSCDKTIQQRTAGLGASDGFAVLNHEVLFHKTGAVLNLTDTLWLNAVIQHRLEERLQGVGAR